MKNRVLERTLLLLEEEDEAAGVNGGTRRRTEVRSDKFQSRFSYDSMGSLIQFHLLLWGITIEAYPAELSLTSWNAYWERLKVA